MPEHSTPRREAAVDRHEDAGIDDSRPGLSRYDLLLAVIPAAFLVGSAVALAADVPLRLVEPVAASIGALALVDGLFLNPPRRPGAGSGPA